MPLQVNQDSSRMSRREGRKISRELRDAGNDFNFHKDISPSELKRSFENAQTSTAKSQYAQAYMMSKYGENVKDFANLASTYAEVYGLDKKTNPYIKFLDDAKKSGIRFRRNSPKTANIFFDMVSKDDPLIDNAEFLTAVKNIKMPKSDDDAFYIQAIRFILDKNKMKQWRPDDPELKKEDVADYKNAILSGSIKDRKELTDILNNKIATQTNEIRPERNGRGSYDDFDEDEVRYNFSRLSPDEQKTFRRLINQIGIKPTALGIRNA